MASYKKDNSARRAAEKKNISKERVKAKAYAKADAKREKPTKRSKKKVSANVAQRDEYASYEDQPKASKRSTTDLEKAYKLVAAQEGMSNAQAKNLIDRGLVYTGNRKVMIARGELPLKTEFKIQKIEKVKPIFENDDLIVVDKPAFMNADEVERQFKDAKLLHRLDRETSGVLMLVKNEEFRERAIQAFRDDEVYKEYTAWVEGIFIDSIDIDRPILTEKRHNKAYSKISKQSGKPARSEVYPLEVSGKKSKVKVIIHEGRTHQIRVHLRSIDFPIVGDEMYGGRRAPRVMLHAKKVTLLGKTFIAPEPKIFNHYSE